MSDMQGESKEIERRKFLRLTGFTLAFVAGNTVLASCGSGGNGTGMDSANSVQGVVRANVVVLPGSVSIVEQTDTSVSLTGNVPPLQPGAVMVSTNGQGLLRKVTAVATSGATTVLTTEPANLEDVYQQAEVRLTREFTEADYAHIDSPYPGVTIGSGRRGRAVEMPITFVKAPFGPLTINGSGRVKVAVNISLDYDSDGLKYARFFPQVSVTGSFDYGIEGEKVFATPNDGFNIGQLTGTPFPIPGPVPIIVVPILSLDCAVSLKLKAGLKISVTATSVAGAGAEYTREAGWKALNQLDKTFTYDGVKVFGEATLAVTPVRASFNLLIYGVTGPSLNIDCPAIETKIERENSLSDIAAGKTTISAKAVFRGTPVFKVAPFGKTLVDFVAPNALEASFDIYNKEYPDQGQVNTEVQ